MHTAIIHPVHPVFEGLGKGVFVVQDGKRRFIELKGKWV